VEHLDRDRCAVAVYGAVYRRHATDAEHFFERPLASQNSAEPCARDLEQ
jgi:hypothetical protein